MKISIVVPILNEEDNIKKLYYELKEKVFKYYPDYQLIFVDDGSTDNSVIVIKNLIKYDNRVEVIILSRNWGHQIALSAGLDNANGDYIITMDGDLQHPPIYVTKMLDKALKEKIDIIHMVKKIDKNRSKIQKVFSKLFYNFFNSVSDTKIYPGASDFRLYSAKAKNIIINIKERDRFLRGLSSWIGLKQDTLEYEVQNRFSGKASYNFLRLLKLASLGLFSFTSFPIKFSILLGITISIIDVIFLIFIFLRNIFYGIKLPGYLSIMTILLLMFSFLFLLLGLIGEYIYKIFLETKGRPLYIIDQYIKKDNLNEK